MILLTKGSWTPLLCPKVFVNADTLHSSTKFINKSLHHTTANVDPINDNNNNNNNNNKAITLLSLLLSPYTLLLWMSMIVLNVGSLDVGSFVAYYLANNHVMVSW
jgi:hypothetical protein